MATISASLGLAIGMVEPPPALAMTWVPVALGLAGVLVLGNYAMQFGAARLAAGTTAVVMLSEVVFASVSSVWLTSATLQAHTLWGGGLIMLAALLATVQNSRTGKAAGV